MPPERSFGLRDSPVHSQEQPAEQPHSQMTLSPGTRAFSAETANLSLRTFDAASFEHARPGHIAQNHRLYSVAPLNSPRHVNSPHQIQSPSYEELVYFQSSAAAAYYHGDHSPMVTLSRLGDLFYLRLSHPGHLSSISSRGELAANGLKDVLPFIALPSLCRFTPSMAGIWFLIQCALHRRTRSWGRAAIQGSNALAGDLVTW
ncbi:hypothetical protein EI94DRAFT_588275 [Lactarius quietus]|nr:hypothetical protein EI94DRAFT_588275 [Lactarius quietus]